MSEAFIMAMVGKALLWIVAAIQTYAFVLEMFLVPNIQF